MKQMSFKEYVEATQNSTPGVSSLLMLFIKANQRFVGYHGAGDGYLDHPCLVNRGVNDFGYHVMFDDPDTQNLWSQWQMASAGTLHLNSMQIDQIVQIKEFKNVISQFENAGFFKKIWLTFKYRKFIKKELEKE